MMPKSNQDTNQAIIIATFLDPNKSEWDTN